VEIVGILVWFLILEGMVQDADFNGDFFSRRRGEREGKGVCGR
jgi:hypothetical protein